MKRLFGLFFNRWVLGAIGLLAAVALIWWVGPLIAIKNFYPFEAEWVRWIQIAVLVFTPIGRYVLRFIKSRKANAALTTGLLKPGPAQAPSQSASAGEVALLGRRFEEALGLLRKRQPTGASPSVWQRLQSLGSRQYLYDLPWYVFIGSPGSGKTTALVNSGLRFPLAGALGREAVRGVGGTRNCDWWFTDEAVLLDTAGRYTTQQSDSEADAQAWKGFLQLLKTSRPRRPINGLLVTVSVADLLQESPAARDAHSDAVRSRVRELYDELGLRFPIYALVTKTDLLAGFTEFFASLGREERGQVWGVTLPYGDARLDPAALAAELENLERRLYERLSDRLEEERDPARRALLYAFPQQFALLRTRLTEFIDRTFSPTQFEAAALLRGVYFTSGTQEGSPIDRVMGAFARNLGLERRLLAPQQPSGRSYFLTRLLREVVFPEAGLAGINLRGERRLQLVQTGAMVAAAALVLIATTAWWISYRHNKQYLSDVSAEVAQLSKQLLTTPAGSKTDLAAVMPTLTDVLTMANADEAPVSWRLGLYQGSKIEAARRLAYRRMLEGTFLPAMVGVLDRALRRDSGAKAEDTYDALKTYVMLYDPKHFNREAVWRWYDTHTQDLLPGADADQQKALKVHFDMLYERGWVDPLVARDDALVSRVRASVGSESLAKRVYDRLKQLGGQDLRDFTVADKGGPKAMLVFQRASREPLTRGVAAFYTKDAYYRNFAKQLDPSAVQLAEEEGWVLGTGRGAVAQAVQTPGLQEAVKRLYLEDYQRLWRQFINDIVLVSDRDLPRMIEVAGNLSAPDTPLKPLIKAIDRETTLSVPPEAEPGLVGSVTGKAQDIAGKARRAIVGGAGDSLVKTIVDDQFQDVHRLAGGAGGNPPPAIDAIVQQLNDYYQFLIAAKVALDAGQSPPPADSGTKLRAESARMPEPFRSMFLNLVESSAGRINERIRIKQVEDLRQQREKQAEEGRLQQEKQLLEARLQQDKQAQDAKLLREKQAQDVKLQEERQAQELKLQRERQAEDLKLQQEKQSQDAKLQRQKQVAEGRQTRDRLDAELRAQVTEFCVRAINGRYPFVRSSTEDVTAQDFARLFAPSGVLDGFFQKQLIAYVDTSQTPWQFKDPAMGTSKALVEFQRAQMIRDIFFGAGGNAPSIQLEFKPTQMDASITQFLLDVDGQIVRYRHGPMVPSRVQFPGPSGRGQVRVSISPPPPSGADSQRFDGPWAIFRMFDEVKIAPTKQPDRFIAEFNVGGRSAVFEVFASSVRNPFRLPELTQFHCPTSL